MVTQTRGKNVAVGGAVLQFLFTAVMVILWAWTGSLSALACLCFLAGGVLLWLMVALLFYCRQLERLEALELEEIAAGGQDAGRIFDSDAESKPAAGRLKWMLRWAVPIFTLLWAGYNLAIGALMLRYLAGREAQPPAHHLQGAMFLIILFLAGFLFSRYTTGMGKRPQWRLLRSTGSYLLINVLMIVSVLGAMISAWGGYGEVDRIIAFVIPVLQLILAGELVVNFVLDLYRPRMPDEEYRPTFESRLYGLVAEPSRVGHSIAEAANYQFGFEVSKTWFFRLFMWALVPLVIFGVLVMFAINSIIIVQEGERCIVMHLGKAPSHHDTLGPGIHFKWPWPIDTAYKVDTSLVQQSLLGVGKDRQPTIIVKDGKKRELFLWTQEHGSLEEKDFLIAIPQQSARPTDAKAHRPPAVNIIKLVVDVQYVVEKPYLWNFRFTNPQRVLKDLAYREMTRYCAAATLDEPLGRKDSDRPEAIMSFGRDKASRKLHGLIQAAADRHKLGIKVTYVGIVSAHPPADAAPAFEDVLKAERGREVDYYKAQAYASGALARVAGDPTTAQRLGFVIRKLRELRSLKELQPGGRGEGAQYRARLEECLRMARSDRKQIEEQWQRDRRRGIQVDKATATVTLKPDGKKIYPDNLYGDCLEYIDLLNEIRSASAAKKHFDVIAQIASADLLADKWLQKTTGEPAALLARARAFRWKQELTERARAVAFQREILAYRACPEVYMLDRYLEVWDEILPGMTKHILGVDQKKLELWLNWETQPGLMEGATYERENAGEK